MVDDGDGSYVNEVGLDDENILIISILTLQINMMTGTKKIYKFWITKVILTHLIETKVELNLINIY